MIGDNKDKDKTIEETETRREETETRMEEPQAYRTQSTAPS